MNRYQRFVRWCQRPSMIKVKGFIDWCREPSRIIDTRAHFWSRLSDRSKDDYLIAYSILLLVVTGLINWNIYSWFALLAIMLLISVWYLRK
jgi:hypothetical protein